VIGDDIVPMERATHENRTGEKDMTHGNDPSEIGLTREKEFSRCLLESMADGVVACDADGILTLFNRTAREWHGIDLLRLPPDEWARHYNLFRPDGISPLPNDEIPLSRAFRGETVTDAGMAIKANGKPIRFILANGSVILDERGQKLGAVVIMRDVTEFRRLEQELRKSNQELEKRVEERTKELRRINGQLQIELSERHRIENSLMMTQFSVDNAADGIMWLRSDGSYCYANEAASRLLGYSASELLTMKASDVNPAHFREEWPQHWEELKRSKTLFFEATLIRKDGSPVPVEIHANYVEFDGQEYNCASVRDITGRKRAETELLVRQQRLSEVTTELSMAEERERRRIATELHDNIGQDLVLARINLGMLAKSPMTSKQSVLLGKTRDILGEMIQRVRSLTHRISPPILENGGLEAALKCLGKQLETDFGLAVVFEHDSGVRPLTEEIRSVLYFAARELLINVAKHAQTSKAAVTIRCENSRFIIKIEDDGAGFDPDSIESTLNKDGNGFGLFNVHRRIKHLGGRFELESSAGLGTRATIVMPLSEGTS